MSDPYSNSRIETLTWTLAVALRRKLGADYRITRVAWSGGQGQGLDLTAGQDQPMFRLSFEGWGGNHLIAGNKERDHPLDANWVWAALAAGWVSVEELARDAAAAARPFRRPVRQRPGQADSYATTAYEFIAAAMRASLVRNLGWQVDTVVPLDDGMGGDAERLELRSTWAKPYLKLFDESPPREGRKPTTTDDVDDWHFIQAPTGPVCAVDPTAGVYLPGVGPVLFADWSRGPAWQSVLRLLDPDRGTGTYSMGAPGTGLTVALAAQTRIATLVDYGLGAARLVDSELHGPALALRPGLRTRLGTAAQLAVPARAWAGRSVRASQIGSAVAGNLASKGIDPDDVVADLVVAWNEGPASKAPPVVVAVFVASDAQPLANIQGFTEQVESAGPVDLRVVVVDLLGALGSDAEVLTPLDLV